MRNKLLIVLFLAICLVPSAGLAVFGPAQAAANETLADTPSLTAEGGGLNLNLLDDLSDWMSDRFALRQELVTAQHALMAAVFHESGTDEVILGSDGWYFYSETLDDWQAVNTMTDREILAAARTLALMQEYCESQGVTFLFTAAPNKNSLYGEYMPARYAAGDTADKNLTRLTAALADAEVSYADLYAALSESDEILYRKQDSHWNARGAALAGDTILTALGLDFDPFFDEAWTAVYEEVGDLYEIVYPTGTHLDEDQACDRAFTFTYLTAYDAEQDSITVMTENEGKSGSLLMFRDSFGKALHPYLAEVFGSAYFRRTDGGYDLTLLDTTGADTLIIELAERDLSNLNTNAPVFPAPEREMTAEETVILTGEAMTVTDADEVLTGYVKLTGSLTAGQIDDDSPICIQVGDAVYEATPAGEAEEGDLPYTAYIPKEVWSGADSVFLLVVQNGQPVKCRIK